MNGSPRVSGNATRLELGAVAVLSGTVRGTQLDYGPPRMGDIRPPRFSLEQIEFAVVRHSPSPHSILRNHRRKFDGNRQRAGGVDVLARAKWKRSRRSRRKLRKRGNAMIGEWGG